ncbi:radical SAM protein [Oligoflexus tunisiensis]|uniref:radical SAM protein n=1 Tax=Oligoflexus tunisiensis TaxID=708132 RepID=UPI000AA60DDB|nr:radical SAM protein [Oligoflexus tunisiensis]
MELPRFVQMEPVGQCNLRCQMCPIQFRQDGPPHGPPAFMEYALFTHLMEQFPSMEELHLQGLGEPLMHPRFFDMVRFAAGRNVKVSVNTNLTLFNSSRAEACMTSGLSLMHVSLDGSTAATYERIRVRSRWSTVLKNLELFTSTQERFQGQGPDLHIVMVLMRQNLHELPDLVRLCQRWPVKQLWVQHLCHDYGEGSLPAHYHSMRDYVNEQTLERVEPAVIEEVFGRARERATEAGMSLRLPRIQKERYADDVPGDKRCDWPWKRAYFSYRGDAMPCCMIATPDRFNFGRIRSEPFAALWQGKAYEAFRQQLASPQPPDICRSCASYTGTF